MTAESAIGSREWAEEARKQRSLTMEDGRERGHVPDKSIPENSAIRERKVEPKRESPLELL